MCWFGVLLYVLYWYVACTGLVCCMYWTGVLHVLDWCVVCTGLVHCMLHVLGWCVGLVYRMFWTSVFYVLDWCVHKNVGVLYVLLHALGRV